MQRERHVRLAGTRNLRDVGGYATTDGRRTRWDTLYRSDCLDRLDLSGQAWLIDAGLRTVIDLRDDQETAETPNVFVGSERVNYRRLPIWTSPPPPGLELDPTNGYVREMNLCGPRFVAIFEELVKPGLLPALVHCAAGKDRTGMVVAMVLAAVGVPRETIAEDYALSSVCLGPKYLAESRVWAEKRGIDWERWAHLFETPPERITRTLDYLDTKFGGVERYLVRHGLAREQLEELREKLTEPD